jgi:hypothetical protein
MTLAAPRRSRTWRLVALFALALAVGVGIGFVAGRVAPRTYSHTTVAVSAKCGADVQRAVSLLRFDTGQLPPPQQAPLQSSASDCRTVDEWATAALRYPSALGSVHDAAAIGQAVTGICASLTAKQQSNAALCVDAKRYSFPPPPAPAQ